MTDTFFSTANSQLVLHHRQEATDDHWLDPHNGDDELGVDDDDDWLDLHDDDDDEQNNGVRKDDTTKSIAGSGGGFFGSSSSDWIEAELTLRNAPSQPHCNLTPDQVAIACCRSLQWVDYPTPLAGLKRCYKFFTFECRKLVTARQGGDSVERFCKYGLLSPALQPFMGATRVDIGQGDQVTLTSARPPMRGAMASYPIVIQGATVLSLRHPSGMNRHGVASAPPITNIVMRLEQQRRPPYQGCWMVREVLDIRHAFAGDMGNVHVGG